MATSELHSIQTRTSGQSHFLSSLERNYGLDLRSLSLFRILLALLLLGDLLIMRLMDLRAHYTDFGILPRNVLLERFSDQWLFSLHLASGRWEFQLLFFAIATFFAVQLLLGYKTRRAAFFSWLLLMSLQNRNELILQGGDVLLRAMTFWAMFVPLNAYWSVDAAMRDSDPEVKGPVLNGGTLGLYTQAILLYVVAAMLKSGAPWRESGLAVWYALSLDQMATPLGHWLLNFPGLLKFLTFFTLAVEFVAPLFLLIPAVSGPVRTVTVILLIGLQLSFRLCLNAGHFAFVASTLMIPLLPTWFWNQARPERHDSWWNRKLSAMRGLTLYYDGGCAFCRKMVLILREFLLSRHTRVLPAQDDPATHEEMRTKNSWIVVDQKGNRYHRTSALAVVLQHSLWAAPLGWLFSRPAVLAVGDRFYAVVERNRPLLSRFVSFLEPRPLKLTFPKWVSAVALLALIYTVYWNLSVINKERFPLAGTRLAVPGVILRLDQNWGMFAPAPLDRDGWYLIAGRFSDNTTADIFRYGVPVDTRVRTPEEIYEQYPNERWRKFMMNLQDDGFQPFRLYYGRYLCRWWNEGRSLSDPKLLREFDIYFYSRRTPLPGETPGSYTPAPLHKHQCFEPPPSPPGKR